MWACGLFSVELNEMCVLVCVLVCVGVCWWMLAQANVCRCVCIDHTGIDERSRE